MPQTVSATLIGTYKSVARAVAACNANGTTSVDVLTVAHQLGACPDIIATQLRSVIANTSGGTVMLALRSYNASQAIFDLPKGHGAAEVDEIFDAIFEVSHSLVK